jgi:hypothetical protein
MSQYVDVETGEIIDVQEFNANKRELLHDRRTREHARAESIGMCKKLNRRH